MKKSTNGNILFIQLNTTELRKINGGGLISAIKTAAAAGSAWALAVLYLFEETVTSPIASYEAFMKGWNACK